METPCPGTISTSTNSTPIWKVPELSGVDAARREAVLAAREILAEGIAGGHDEVPMRILIADETGNRPRSALRATRHNASS